MTFGWRHVWTIVAILIGGFAALLALSIWHQRSERRGHQLDRLALPVMSGTATDHGDYKVRPGGCALPTKNVVIDPRPVTPEVLNRLSQLTEWKIVSEHMKAGDIVYFYRRHPTAPADISLLSDVSGGVLVLRGRCLVGMYAYWNKYAVD